MIINFRFYSYKESDQYPLSCILPENPVYEKTFPFALSFNEQYFIDGTVTG